MDSDPSSIWTTKPWWCQPWTIVLTGAALVGCSWVLVQRWWISAGVGLLVVSWWTLFLVLVPAAYKRDVEAGMPLDSDD
jgi:hypothetical protein